MTKQLFRKGVRYCCTNSQSTAYTKGRVYEAYLNNDRKVCLKGDDGHEDLCTMLVSSFEEIGHTVQPKLRIVK